MLHKTKFTKGPWHVGNPCTTFIYNSKEKIVGEAILSDKIKMEEVVSNAHLMAAAPELLEAVQTLFIKMCMKCPVPSCTSDERTICHGEELTNLVKSLLIKEK